ncbi:MAG: hypothetical protein B7Y41_01145 [Hydrogenophilales bacterium 28-61-23]|nr:MAG: hypothetical protein B7Y41_01145 [Hydrogenophilales bacterium 28-61-23]
MALRARLSAPRAEQEQWPWHQAKWTALSAALIFGGDRRMEAENYLAGGYGIRLAMEARKAGWTRMGDLADVWQPSRLKGIQVSPDFGTPFLAATQVFDLRPVPRKFLALEKVKQSADLFVTSGQILVTRSGSVGRATLAHAPHEKIIISDDLLRVDPRQEKLWGWLYAYLRAPQTRAMMTSAQYGHIIKHLETGHLNALPMPVLRDDLLVDYTERVKAILDMRNQAHELARAAEARFEQCFGPLVITDNGEAGFNVRASTALFSNRRRFDALPHNPVVKSIYEHLTKRASGFTKLADAGFSVWLPNRFKRVPAADGLGLLGSSDLFEINPDITKRIADGNFGDAYNAHVKAGWLLLARSGQIYGLNGSLTLATKAHEAHVVSDHIIRIAPQENASIRPGYLCVALSHPELGRPLMKSLPYGSSIPEIEVADVEQLAVVRLDASEENAIADMAEEASSLRAQADILENELAADAEAILDRFIAGDMQDVVVSP